MTTNSNTTSSRVETYCPRCNNDFEIDIKRHTEGAPQVRDCCPYCGQWQRVEIEYKVVINFDIGESMQIPKLKGKPTTVRRRVNENSPQDPNEHILDLNNLDIYY